MKTSLVLTSIACLVGSALASAVGATFVPGDVFSLPSSGALSDKLMNITGGGDFSGSPGLAVVEGSQSQMAWSLDLTTLYVTRYATNNISVWAISATGAVTSFATNAGSPNGIVRTADGRLLIAVVSGADGSVVDIAVGGNFSGAPAFATGFRKPMNLVQLANGHILLSDADNSLPKVWDITAGGHFTDNDQGFAFGFHGGLGDIVQTSTGRIFVAQGNKVFDITAGGDFSLVTPFATGQPFAGLTEDGSGRLLASVPSAPSANSSGKVYDITSGGSFTFAAPFAFGLDPRTGAALDTVPAPEPTSSAMLAIGAALLSMRRGRNGFAS